MADKDAIALLKQDHRDAKELFKHFEKAKGDGRKEKLAHEICLALSVHFQLEEQIFYPACEGTVEEDELKEGYVEHDAAKLLVAEIEANQDADDDFFDTKVHVLLPSPVPIYVTYLTAQVHDGQLSYVDDIYGRDSQYAALH